MTQYHLGINLGHDRSAALIKDGAICCAIQQERLDRYKHSIGFLAQSGANPKQVELPTEAINYCLENAGIEWEDVATITANMPGVDYADQILRRKLPKNLHHKIRQIPSHHLAHAYTAYWPSGFDESLVLVADASGSISSDNLTESYTLYTGKSNQLHCLHSEKVQCHLADLSTLGFIYEYVSRKADFVTRLESGISVPESGKLMGLAPFGGHQTQWKKWFQMKEKDYSISISPYDIFLEIAALEKQYDDGTGKAYLRPYLVDLAFKVQQELELALLHIVETAKKETGLTKLCLAGGVALNSVANYRLLRDLNLQDIFTYPAAGDGGIAAGCALWAYATQEKGEKRPLFKSASLGKTYKKDQIEIASDKHFNDIIVEELSSSEMVEKCAKSLAKGHIIARVDGGSEYGPRALGHRTILADPTFEKMRDIINARVKFRESFRPFAPVIPEECVGEVFEHQLASPFMLLISPIHEHYQKVIPSVTHHDGTGRLQTVTAEANPFMHALCHKISSERKGPPVVLNTSFNVAGQPIVETPEEAIETFLNTDIDYLCIGNHWIYRKNQGVLDYEEHLDKVKLTPMPEGLKAQQPSVDELMNQLDRALFFEESEACPWDKDELQKLSRFGARFKETSRLYPVSPFGETFNSKFTDDVVLVLDPLGKSIISNVRSDKVLGQYVIEDVQLLIAVFNDDAKQLSILRRERQCNTAMWHERCEWATTELLRFGVTRHDLGLDNIVTQQSPVIANNVDLNNSITLANFSDPTFSLREKLKQFKQILIAENYNEEVISLRLDVESLQQIEPTHLAYFDQFKLGQTRLDDLIRLFLLRGALSKATICEHFGSSLVSVLIDIGIFIERGEKIASRVDVFVVDGLFLATDHRFMLLPEDKLNEDPIMYIGLDSLGLAVTAPRYVANDVLDLCTGSGVQALTASCYANSVTAVDLNPRAIRFVRFNAQLNGIENVEAVQSDLYKELNGSKYDIILANPPFVPSPENDLKFRDGGKNGEQILARIIEEAAPHLNEDGRLHIVTDLVDVLDYQQKLNNWWKGGACSKMVLTTADRDELLFSVPHSHYPFGQTFDGYNQELQRWVNNFRHAELNKVNFGYIIIHQHNNAMANSYNAKVIHSPKSAIHESVKSFQEEQETYYASENKEKLFLQLHPELCCREERKLDGSIQSIELYVPNNPLFTAYGINQPLMQILTAIGKKSIQIKNVDPAFKVLIIELLNKGLLISSEMETKVSQNNSISVQSPIENLESIQELASKTTPTCLTSYMQS